MADLFISYSQPDSACAMELVSRLEADGFHCWVAPRDIAPAADWAEEIINAIETARMMVLVFSHNSNESAQVRREVERAVHKRLPILPFRIEDVLPTKSLEYFLSSQHWMDAFPAPLDAHYIRLSAHLRDRLAGITPHRSADPSGIFAAPSGTFPSLIAPRCSLDEADLKLIESRLATYIGPMARLLVRKALARAASRQELIDRLAAELDAEADRQRFSSDCRLSP
jgi:hypothetical protein